MNYNTVFAASELNSFVQTPLRVRQTHGLCKYPVQFAWDPFPWFYRASSVTYRQDCYCTLIDTWTHGDTAYPHNIPWPDGGPPPGMVWYYYTTNSTEVITATTSVGNLGTPLPAVYDVPYFDIYPEIPQTTPLLYNWVGTTSSIGTSRSGAHANDPWGWALQRGLWDIQWTVQPENGALLATQELEGWRPDWGVPTQVFDGAQLRTWVSSSWRVDTWTGEIGNVPFGRRQYVSDLQGVHTPGDAVEWHAPTIRQAVTMNAFASGGTATGTLRTLDWCYGDLHIESPDRHLDIRPLLPSGSWTYDSMYPFYTQFPVWEVPIGTPPPHGQSLHICRSDLTATRRLT